MEIRVPRGPPNRPKIEPRTPKRGSRGCSGGSRKGCRKNTDFQIPMDSENEAPVYTIAKFSLFEGTPKMEPKWLPNPSGDAPRSLRERSRNESKNEPNIDAKRESKWTPTSHENRQKERRRPSEHHWEAQIPPGVRR